MELTPKQQAIRVIEDAKSILLITHQEPDGDALGSLLATKQVLENLGKSVTTVVAGLIDHSFSFLPQFFTINSKPLNVESKIIISEPTGHIEAISWKRLTENKIELLLSGSKLVDQDIQIMPNQFDFQAVIILDTATPTMLGSIWEENADLFYEVPTIVIDHHSTNTQFAKINIVDITASATAEILVSVFEALGKSNNIFTPEIATCLLTGIMTDTVSFMNANTTPKSLTVAAQLVAAGAKQQEIVRKIFKTNSLSKLRIWGRVLSYIKEDQSGKFIWSTLSKADFVAAGSGDQVDDAKGVVDTLLKTADKADFVLLLKEKNSSIHGSLRSISPTVDVSAIARLFGGGGHAQAAGFDLKDQKLADLEMEIINKIRQYCFSAAKI